MDRRELQALSGHVEALLDGFRDAGDEAAAERAEDLVRSLLELYGAGLARVVELADGTPLVRQLADDELVGSLLVLHDLHPDDVDSRIQAALDRVRPYLGSHAGGIDYLGVDEAGVAHLTLQGSCDGCPSSSVTVTLTIERAVLEAAPEVQAVDVTGVVAEEKPLLQIGLRPGIGPPAASPAPVGAGEWQHVELDLPAGMAARVEVAGTPLLVVDLAGTAYAYRDRCPACDRALSGGRLAGDVLTCESCGSAYDVRLAGRGLAPGSAHLDPLPLLPDGAGWKVALPGGVPV